MPFTILTKTLKQQLGRRVLISGRPNTRKTTSLMTWPHGEKDGYLHLLSYPGEKGYDTVDLDDEWIKPYIWLVDDPSKTNPHKIIKEVEDTTLDILMGQHGKVHTFAGDGLHKLYSYYWARSFYDLTGGSTDPQLTEKMSGRAYGMAHDHFITYLTKVTSSKVPFAVFTVWVGRDKDDPQNLQKNAPTHIWPDLPGQLAQRVLGEFSVTVYAEVGQSPSPDKEAPAWWQIQPGGSVWGAACKAPPKIASKLPMRIPQHFAALYRVLQESELSEPNH